MLATVNPACPPSESSCGVSGAPSAAFACANTKGTRLHFGTPPDGKDRARSRKMIAPYPTGQAVSVRYNPRRPTDSALEPGVAAFWSTIVAFSIVCIGLAVVGC